MNNCEIYAPLFKKFGNKGVTLIELLASVAIISVLSTLGCVVCKTVLSRVGATAEISAAKNLIQAYNTYAADNNGRLLQGVTDKSTSIVDKNGKELSSIVAKRWVPRLAAYFDYHYIGTVVVNNMKKEFANNVGKPSILSMPAEVYVASAFPSLGLNGTFVGGNYRVPLDSTGTFSSEPTTSDAQKYGPFYVSTTAQAVKPSSLIVFASARCSDDLVGGSGGVMQGNEYIYAPRTTGDLRWSSNYREKDSSGSFGHVHPRWEGKAVTAMLDGSVRMLDTEELKDMRHWSNQAAEADDPNWSLQEIGDVGDLPPQ